jgi:putative multiple sugar transport system ATP-binding protein
MGAGRTELAMSVFGRAYGQRITRRGADARRGHRRLDDPEGDRHGIAYVTEDRKSLGLILLDDDIRTTSRLANLRRCRPARRDRRRRRVEGGGRLPRKLNIRCSGRLQKTVNLSGGNQQKVVLANGCSPSPRC